MNTATEMLFDTISKSDLNEGLDELFSSYFLNEEPTHEQKKLVFATVFGLKRFLKES